MFTSNRPLLDDSEASNGPLPFIIYQHVRKKWSPVLFIKRLSLKQWMFAFIFLSIISFVAFNELIPTRLNSWIRVPPKVTFRCHQTDPRAAFNQLVPINNQSESVPSGQLRSDSKILLLVDTLYSRLGKQIGEVFDSVKFKYKVEIAGKNLPLLTSNEKGKFHLIVFENLHKYFGHWSRDALDNYCRQFNVGVIGFVQNLETESNNIQPQSILTIRFKNYPVLIKTGYQLKDYQLSHRSSVLRIARSGAISLGDVPGRNWSTFHISPNSTTFSPIAQAHPRNFRVDSYPGGYKYSSVIRHQSLDLRNSTELYKRNLLTTVLQDNGSFDGVKRVLFGNGLNFWIHKMLLLDAATYLTNGMLNLPLQRYVQIDIDDIFVGESGTRLKIADVDALIDTQRRLQLLIDGFRFNLGFSGKFYHRGYAEEDDGDDYLIGQAKHFRWFCHMYSHSQSHLTNNHTYIENEMLLNREFAKANNLPVDTDYSVSPHHSGVYPIHEPLYKAWRKVSKVRVTSTEEYLHLRPSYLHRGFVYNDIMILPRQTCGLYTHTIFIDKYPGGRSKLERSIFGGELFYSFVFNQFNVFMTHQSNYANDRLAAYTFESVVKFVQCWTNLQLLSLSPLQMAKKYFQVYPEERAPIWTNPCEDKRHYNIWSTSKSCFKLPKFIILGPQKTGSTALYTFLSQHPSVISNRPSNQTFEEVQFFNGNNYYKGIDWYMDFFPLPDSFRSPENATASSGVVVVVNSTSKNQLRNPPVYHEGYPYFFEKSSNYFDGELVPLRVHSLLPHAKLVVIVINPSKRAYSWYQHMRAHNLSVAVDFTFYEVVTLDVSHKQPNEKTMKRLRALRNRCLNPGMYALHLDQWLLYYPPAQITIIDGEELRTDPVNVMDKLQLFLKLTPYTDYNQLLRFDKKKGFYCQITEKNGTKCLGRSKGRHYTEMDEQSKQYLHRFYHHHNVALFKMLTRLHVPIPAWLVSELN